MKTKKKAAPAEGRTLKEQIEDWLKTFNPRTDFVPVPFWAKDHWSTFAYIETCCVDGGGLLQTQRMRCNPRIHREYAHMPWDVDYPTRLKEGAEITPHDDWSCVEDMVAAGLVEVVHKRRRSRNATGTGLLEQTIQLGRRNYICPMLTQKLRLTPLGIKIAQALREHKIKGGVFSTFDAPIVEQEQAA